MSMAGFRTYSECYISHKMILKCSLGAHTNCHIPYENIIGPLALNVRATQTGPLHAQSNMFELHTFKTSFDCVESDPI